MIILKLGLVPIHTWFVTVGSKIKWKILTIMITWQKIIPIYLLMFASKYFILIRAILSIIIGTVLQYKNIDRKKLIIYSRISNSCWILLAALLNLQMTIIFCLIYFSIVIISIIILENKIQTKNEQLKDREEIVLTFITILILAGIPPSVGFFPKWILFKEFLQNNISFVALMIFFFTTVNFYIYLRLFIKVITKKENRNYSNIKMRKKTKVSIISLISFGVVLLSVFCFAWKRIILIE